MYSVVRLRGQILPDSQLLHDVDRDAKSLIHNTVDEKQIGKTPKGCHDAINLGWQARHPAPR